MQHVLKYLGGKIMGKRWRGEWIEFSRGTPSSSSRGPLAQ
jgi:hypothetical protein